MYVGDFDPIAPDETDAFDFNFADQLSGETIDTATWVVAVKEGTDASPSSHLISSPYTAANNTKSVQRLGNFVAGVIYTLEAQVVTSSGRHLSKWGHVKCVVVQ